MDDTHTLVLSVTFTPWVNGTVPELPSGYNFDITESLTVHRLQDYQAICSQGLLTNRSREHLGASDAGVILLRKMIKEGIDAVQRGQDPKMVWRRPEDDRLVDLSGIVIDGLLDPAG